MAAVQHPSSIVAPRRSSRRMAGRERWGYLFIAPFFLLYAVFGLYPTLFSFYLSFTNWKGTGPQEFVGLANYARVLKDGLFWQSMWNSALILMLHLPLMLLAALVLAVLLNSRRVRGFRIFRTMIFLPFITNMAAAGFTFQILFAKNNGLVNSVLSWVGLPGVPWLETIWGARVTLCLLIIWAWLGYMMVIMLAGLQTIPADLTEAAQVDGATPVQAFWHITVPLMRPVLLFTSITSTIGTFGGLFAEVMVLTRGGPTNATITPIIRMYKVAFESFQFGYASALGYTFFALIFGVTLLQLRVFERES